jgi:hypothetical protein
MLSAGEILGVTVFLRNQSKTGQEALLGQSCESRDLFVLEQKRLR